MFGEKYLNVKVNPSAPRLKDRRYITVLLQNTVTMKKWVTKLFHRLLFEIPSIEKNQFLKTNKKVD
jgi:hypothetical protein